MLGLHLVLVRTWAGVRDHTTPVEGAFRTVGAPAPLRMPVSSSACDTAARSCEIACRAGIKCMRLTVEGQDTGSVAVQA
jgi:hypothetical protein